MHLFVNGVNVQKFELTDTMDILHNQVTVEFSSLFNYVKEKDKSQENSYAMGSFGMFSNLKHSQLMEFHTNGYIWMRRSEADKLFIFRHTKDSPAPKYSTRSSNHFVNILTHQCRINIILPIFKFITTKFENGEECKTLLSNAMEILINALMFSTDAEKSFVETQGFVIINYLLKQSDPKILTFDLYTKFFDIL